MKHSQTEEKIKELFFDFPNRRFHTREISRIIKVSAPAVSKALKNLGKQGFLSVKKKFLHEITASRTERFTSEKKLSNLKRIYDSGLRDYLKEEFPLTTIVLFGSYSRGEDTEKSDIDIAILGKEQKLNIKKYSDLLKKQINIQYLNMKKISKELRNNLFNGILLSGAFDDEF